MPIEINCSCGRNLNLRDELAGKLIRCPDCAGTLQVPAADPEIIEGIVPGPPPLPSSLPQRKVDEIELAPPVILPERPKEPKKKKKKKKSVYSEYYGGEPKESQLVAFDEGWLGNINGGIVGGILSMLIGIALVVIFLAVGSIRISILGVLLIIAGFIGIIKGLMELY